MATLFKTNFEHEEITPENGTDFQLHEMYKLLDCRTIDILTVNDEHVLVIDDEGKFVDKPILNVPATDIWWKYHMKPETFKKHSAGLNLFGIKYAFENNLDVLVGNVLYCSTEMIK